MRDYRAFDEQVRVLIESGKSQTETAAALGVSRTRVRSAQDRAGVGYGPVNHWSASDLDTLYELWDEGVSYAKIGKAIGRKMAGVRQKCRDLGLVRRKEPEPIETAMGDVEWSTVDGAYAAAGIRYEDDPTQASLSERYGGLRQMKSPASVHESFCGNSAAMCAGS